MISLSVGHALTVWRTPQGYFAQLRNLSDQSVVRGTLYPLESADAAIELLRG